MWAACGQPPRVAMAFPRPCSSFSPAERRCHTDAQGSADSSAWARHGAAQEDGHRRHLRWDGVRGFPARPSPTRRPRIL